MTNKNCYDVDVICLNCGYINNIYVEQGNTTKKQIRTEAIRCKHCNIRIDNFKVSVKHS